MANIYSQLASDVNRTKVPKAGQYVTLTLPKGGKTGLWSVRILNERSFRDSAAGFVKLEIKHGSWNSQPSRWGESYGEKQKSKTADEAWTVVKRNVVADINSGAFEKFVNNL